MNMRERIVAEARDWISTPYHHQARLKGVGVDCLGLPICIARALGLVAPDFDFGGYSRQPDGVTILRECDALMQRTTRAAMLPGDLLVTATEGLPNHFGVLADYRHGGLSVIEALGTRDGRGKVVERRLDAASLDRQFVAAFVLPGVA
jgi:cell wall-associated NlpC family hydrolase